jgi:hypothetical protein
VASATRSQLGTTPQSEVERMTTSCIRRDGMGMSYADGHTTIRTRQPGNSFLNEFKRPYPSCPLNAHAAICMMFAPKVVVTFRRKDVIQVANRSGSNAPFICLQPFITPTSMTLYHLYLLNPQCLMSVRVDKTRKRISCIRRRQWCRAQNRTTNNLISLSSKSVMKALRATSKGIWRHGWALRFQG